MNLASKTLSRQRKQYIYIFIQGLLLIVIGSFSAVMLLTKGLGTPSKGSTGKAQRLLSIITKIVGDKADPEKVMVYLLAAMVSIGVCFGIYYLVQAISHVQAPNTVLGKSLLHQAKNYESLSDTLAAIDADLNQSVQTYGKVSIGREWILGEMAMRLASICGVFWIDEGEADFIMYCVDEKQNIWTTSFTYPDDREHTIQLIRKRYPELTYGDQDAFIAYTKKNDK